MTTDYREPLKTLIWGIATGDETPVNLAVEKLGELGSRNRGTYLRSALQAYAELCEEMRVKDPITRRRYLEPVLRVDVHK